MARSRIKHRPFGITTWAEPYWGGATLTLGTSTAQPLRLSELARLAGFDVEDLISGDPKLGHGPLGGALSLREAIASHVSGVSPENVAVTGGAGEALFALGWSLAEGDQVIVEAPAHQSIFAALDGRGCTVTELVVPVDVDTLLEAIGPETAAVFLASPHNPTGHVWEESELRSIAAKLADSGGMLVVDEAFWGVGIAKRVQPRAASVAVNAVSVGGFSKVLGLPGIRVGWAAGPTLPIDDVRSLHTHVARSLPLMSEKLALLAMRAQPALLARTRRLVASSLPLVKATFDRHPERIELPEPDGGTVGLARMPGIDVEEWCRKLALEAGILLAPGGACFGLPGTVSMNLALQSAVWEEAVPILDRALEALPSVADSLSAG